MTRAAEFIELDDDELQNRIASSRRELLNLRFQLATGQLDNTQRIGDVRRDIARALTVLRARDLYEEDVELEPLVLTPARRIPIDESGGADSDGDPEDEADGDHDHEHDHDHDGADAGADADADVEDSADPGDTGAPDGDEEDTEQEDGD
jgi:large subunit ribosomal protein L29